MKTDRRIFKLAFSNAAILAALLYIVLCVFEQDITFRLLAIYFGYSVICLLVELPLFYISIRKNWFKDGFLSIQSLYLPLLSFCLLLPLTMLYSSVIYGYPPLDYFYTPDGGLNTVQLSNHLRMTLTGVAFVFANQALGASTEREIIINSKPKFEDNHEKLNIPGMTVNVSDLLYVESEGNYLRVVCKSEERKIRMTLKQFVSEYGSIPGIIPSHRAYVVNLLNVSYYEGSSRKGEIHFHGRMDTVPVSRNHVRTIIDSLSNLH